ncbi:DUF4915 domain-containing protein [Colwellia sp. MB02u-10]|uniref:DUF4915 domain-containing protein n=1 Tax=Colwellia sp. MB02u-10 TaxID=2759828 RepID=UPI001C70BFB4|nr:DUF4915 domain-containing protein [Colwellia sp. MB02u-10]
MSRQQASNHDTQTLCFFVLCLTLFVTYDASGFAIETIVFNDLSKPMTLIKEDGQNYKVESKGQQVTLSNRLIVKAQTQLTKAQLYQYHPHRTQVSELFTDSQFHYFSLTLKDGNNLGDVLNALQSMAGIELVQPDVLQRHSHTSIKNKPNKAPVSLSEEQMKHRQEKRPERRKKIKLSEQTRLKHKSLYLSQQVKSIWQTTQGQGVKVAIIDDGFNLQHLDLKPEDLCHLNGTTLKDGKPADVIIFSQEDQAGMWRKKDGEFNGTLMDVASNEILLDGLAMPHSPRWYNDQVYFFNSDHGHICSYDPQTKITETLAEVPGFTQGMDFYRPIMFVGLSPVRTGMLPEKYNETFSGI